MDYNLPHIKTKQTHEPDQLSTKLNFRNELLKSLAGATSAKWYVRDNKRTFSPKWHKRNKQRNKEIKCVYGNINKSINIIHWNLGPRRWENKTEDIQLLVDELNPNIAFISEANYWYGLSPPKYLIQGYELITANTMDNLGYSRIIALVREGTQIRIMHELMNKNDLASIWLRWGGNGQRSIIVGGIYREHTLLGQDDPSTSSSPIEQRNRWNNYISQWKAAGRIGQCIIIRDLNLDIQKWHMPDQAVAEMTEATKTEIETENFVQLIDTPTRFWVNQEDSILDHIWVNNPQKVISKNNIRRSTADHNMIQLIYRTKGKISNSNEIVRRSKKNFNAEKYRER